MNLRSYLYFGPIIKSYHKPEVMTLFNGTRTSNSKTGIDRQPFSWPRLPSFTLITRFIFWACPADSTIYRCAIRYKRLLRYYNFQCRRLSKLCKDHPTTYFRVSELFIARSYGYLLAVVYQNRKLFIHFMRSPFSLRHIHDQLSKFGLSHIIGRSGPSRRIYVVKPNGKLRPLTIAPYLDRLANALMAPLFGCYHYYHTPANQYSYRKGSGTITLVCDLIQRGFGLLPGFSAFELDLASFFNSVSRDFLYAGLDLIGCSSSLLSSVSASLSLPINEAVGGKDVSSEFGCEQGYAHSAVLAVMALAFSSFYTCARDLGKSVSSWHYADDIIVFGRGSAWLSRVIDTFNGSLVDTGARISEAKSKVADFGAGVKFVGFIWRNGNLYCQPRSASSPILVGSLSWLRSLPLPDLRQHLIAIQVACGALPSRSVVSRLPRYLAQCNFILASLHSLCTTSVIGKLTRKVEKMLRIPIAHLSAPHRFSFALPMILSLCGCTRRDLGPDPFPFDGTSLILGSSSTLVVRSVSFLT